MEVLCLRSKASDLVPVNDVNLSGNCATVMQGVDPSLCGQIFSNK
ncbi:MAG: hypothetical protein JWO06_1310 [Bacteroidota bacterium]|nr:hypothetical protein [Bacteroidota bacterium]